MTAPPAKDFGIQQIAFILPSFAGGGAERVVINLLRLVDRQLFSPALIVLDSRGPLADQVPDDVTVCTLGQWRMRKALPALVAALRRIRPAVVFSSFTHVNMPLLAVSPLLAGARLLVREANLPSANLPRMPWPWAFQKGYRWLYPKAHAVIASSARMREELCAMGVPSPTVCLLHNPVDEGALRSAAEPAIRHPGEGVRFVAAGRLSLQKGFDRLLEAMAALPVDSHCTILGEGPERTALEERISHLDLKGRVTLAGFIANPAPRIAGADAFVMPSRFEGMPNAALEALALGTPVMATPESGGIVEVEGIVVAEAGTAFVAAMKATKVDPVTAPRSSLLPPHFRIEAVAKGLNLLLARAVDRA
jgi:glycosyltransferase involved in cell wall biosynthesis